VIDGGAIDITLTHSRYGASACTTACGSKEAPCGAALRHD
jgi:hypothetical protein